MVLDEDSALTSASASAFHSLPVISPASAAKQPPSNDANGRTAEQNEGEHEKAMMEEEEEEDDNDEGGENGAKARRCSSSSPLVSEGSALDCDLSLSSANGNRGASEPTVPNNNNNNNKTMNQHTENSSAAYFLWPAAYRLHGSAEDRTAYFYGVHKEVDVEMGEKVPCGQQAATLLDVMTIRAYHSKRLRRVSLGTALGFRTRHGVLTNIPSIIVLVARKVHKAWLQEGQRLPVYLEGPGGIWCDVDVVEFAYYGTPTVTPKEQVYTELVEGLRGGDPCIGPGSQVASQETYGTLGAIVQSRVGARQVGFLTNRHVAVDLDYPNQKMFHPLPPNVGPGIYLGAVERATSFITDERWYSIFASLNPETFVRADGAFIPFGESFDMSRVTTTVKGVGDMGDVYMIDLQAPIGSVVGRQVVKVGRSSGVTKGRVMAYALEYNDEKGICFFTDFLIVGENRQAFDLEGDSGSLVLMVEPSGQKPRPVGIIWGGTANRGRLKLRSGHGPENWTSGVDLGRLLECLQLELITSNSALKEAIENQRRLMPRDIIVGECCSKYLGTGEGNQQPSSLVNSFFRVPTTHHMEDQAVHRETGYFGNSGKEEIIHEYDEEETVISPRVREPIDFIKEFDSRIHKREHGQHEDLPILQKACNEELFFGLHLPDKDSKSRW